MAVTEEELESFVQQVAKLAQAAEIPYHLFVARDDGDALSVKVAMNTKHLGMTADKQGSFALAFKKESEHSVARLAAAALMLKFGRGCPCKKCQGQRSDESGPAAEGLAEILH